MRLDVENVNGSAVLAMLQHKDLVISNEMRKRGYDNFLDDEYALSYLEMMGVIDVKEIALVKQTRQLAQDFQEGKMTAIEMFEKAKLIAKKNITSAEDIKILNENRIV